MIAATSIATARLWSGVGAADLHWQQLPALPDRLGVAGAFAGVSDGRLIVAGGANFPDKLPWEGGRKVWHDTVYSLSNTNGSWQVLGKLPRPLAYGVSLTTASGVLCIGGSDSERHYPDVFLLVYTNQQLQIRPVPPLPVPLANGAGAMVGHVAHVTAGSELPGEQAAVNRHFALDLSSARLAWWELPSCPGEARILPVAGGSKDAFYLAGGAALRNVDGKVKRVYLRDAWKFSPTNGWRRLPDLPKPCVAAPSPAPIAAATWFLVGGDDGSLAGFAPPERHPGFARTVLTFDIGAEAWMEFNSIPAARATLPVVEWQGRFIFPSGEVRPGVRSPEVWSVQVQPTR